MRHFVGEDNDSVRVDGDDRLRGRFQQYAQGESTVLQIIRKSTGIIHRYSLPGPHSTAYQQTPHFAIKPVTSLAEFISVLFSNKREINPGLVRAWG